MGTWVITTLPHRRGVLMLAAIIGLLLALASTGTARAGGACQVTIEPSTIAEGGQFVVTGNFGANAEVHLVRGEDQAFPEDSQPVYTLPDGHGSLQATITMGAGTEGTWTVWGFIPATECGDSAILTVTAGVPDTAMTGNPGWVVSLLGALLLALALLGLGRRGVVDPASDTVTEPTSW